MGYLFSALLDFGGYDSCVPAVLGVCFRLCVSYFHTPYLFYSFAHWPGIVSLHEHKILLHMHTYLHTVFLVLHAIVSFTTIV